MPKKRNDIPAELTDKWKINTMNEGNNGQWITSALNVPPKLEECLMSWSIDMPNHPLKKPKEEAVQIVTPTETVPPPRPPRPRGMSQSGNRPMMPQGPPPPVPAQTQSPPVILPPSQAMQKSRPNMVPTNPLLPQQPRPQHAQNQVMDTERSLPVQPFNYQVPMQQQISIKTGPVPHALNLETGKSPFSYVPQQTPPNHLPPIQELFKTADHPNLFPPTYVPTPMAIDEDRALLNNLTSRFMNFSEEPKKEIKIPEKPQKSDEPGGSPPQQRHTI